MLWQKTYPSLGFAVFNNPADHGYEGSPKEICDRLKMEWCHTETRTGAWAYCIKHYVGHYEVYDEDGEFQCFRLAMTEEEKALVKPDLHHVHMVLEDTKAMRWSAVKNTYAIGMHFKETLGTKSEAEDYISKTGKYSEKEKKEAGLPWEEIIYVARYGEIKGRQGQRPDKQNIARLLAEGKTPSEILAENFNYYAYESMIRSAYFDIRDKQTPPEREVKVIWHCGASGSGKSYDRIKLIEREGESRIFYLTSFKTGAFDKYNGEPILWIEDYKGDFRFGDLLRYLDKYKCELPARFKNGKALWSEVHITSILHPLGAYQRMLAEKDQQGDGAEQLLRRISIIRYHWKDENSFHSRDFPIIYKKGLPVAPTLEYMRQVCLEGKEPIGAEYTDPELYRVNFIEISSDEELPF